MRNTKTIAPTKLSFLFLTMGTLAASAACNSAAPVTSDGPTGSVASAQSLKDCRRECSDNSVRCHGKCGQDHDSSVDIECHRSCTRIFNDCYLNTCPILADDESETLDPTLGGDKPPSADDPNWDSPDTVSAPDDPGLPKEFYGTFTFTDEDTEWSKKKGEEMKACYDGCTKDASSTACFTLCYCVVYDERDPLTCEKELSGSTELSESKEP